MTSWGMCIHTHNIRINRLQCQHLPWPADDVDLFRKISNKFKKCLQYLRSVSSTWVCILMMFPSIMLTIIFHILFVLNFHRDESIAYNPIRFYLIFGLVKLHSNLICMSVCVVSMFHRLRFSILKLCNHKQACSHVQSHKIFYMIRFVHWMSGIFMEWRVLCADKLDLFSVFPTKREKY